MLKGKLRPYDFWSDGVTQGLLKKFLECRQLAKLYLQGWTSNRVGSALLHGILTHSVLERLHEWQRKTKLACPSRESVLKMVEYVLSIYRKKEGLRWSAEQVNEFNQIGAQIQAVVPAYFQYWKSKPLQWLEIEGVFRIKHTFGPGAKDWTWLTGRLDGLYTAKGALGLFDAKNKSQISQDQFGEVLLRDWQINFYLLAVWKMTKRYPNEFIYNVMRRPGLEFRKTDSLVAYRARIEDHIQEKGGDYYFSRYAVAVDKADLLAFEQELNGVLFEFKQWLEAGMPSRLFGQPCITKYGLCSMVPIDYNGDFSFHHQREEMFSELSEG